MRYVGTTKVAIPYTGYNGGQEVAVLRFVGDVDRRRIYREIRKFVKHNFGIQVTKEWIQKVPVIIPEPQLTAEEIQQVTEDFIRRIEYNEDQDEGHSESQGSTPEGSEQPLCSVPDQT